MNPFFSSWLNPEDQSSGHSTLPLKGIGDDDDDVVAEEDSYHADDHDDDHHTHLHLHRRRHHHRNQLVFWYQLPF